MANGQRAARQREKEHNCKKLKVSKIHHWFGSSSSEDTENEQDENWSKVEREQDNLNKKKRRKERLENKKAELTIKARRMAGIGPISSQEIDRQKLKTRNYEQAKSWAVKAHLEKHYRYDLEELKNLEILETKRNAKEEIIYIAVADERDIKDIYSRKAECRSDDTIVRSFIPPQYWDRFAALNRICTQRRTQDALLKTQIRFGTRDLIVLTKEKGARNHM